jgi:hypothetical protein
MNPMIHEPIVVSLRLGGDYMTGMQGFTAILSDWHTWAMFLGYSAFSNAISAMPSPDASSGKTYSWAFKFLNGFASNISRAAAGKIPGVDVMPPVKPDTLNTTVVSPVQPNNTFPTV